jgi:hypothetical protein
VCIHAVADPKSDVFEENMRIFKNINYYSSQKGFYTGKMSVFENALKHYISHKDLINIK